VVDVLLALLIVLLFAALPTQSYSVYGRKRSSPQADKPKPASVEDKGIAAFAINPQQIEDVAFEDQFKPKATEKGKFEAGVDAIEWELRSKFRSKWKDAALDCIA